MSCCTSRNLSWASAILSLIGGICGAIFCGCFFLIPKKELQEIEEFRDNKKAITLIMLVMTVFHVLLIPFSITLMVGIKQNRFKLFMPFNYLMQLFIFFILINSTRAFVRGLFHKGPFGELALDLFLSFLYAVVIGLFLLPVYTLYRELRSSESPVPVLQPEEIALNQPMANASNPVYPDLNNAVQKRSYPVQQPSYPVQQQGYTDQQNSQV